MIGRRLFGAFVGALGLAVLAASALAQDYTLSRPGGKYEAPPAGATRLGIVGGSGTQISLPFSFPYFGLLYSSVWVDSEGFIQFGRYPQGSANNNQAIPPSSSLYDGVCAPCWDGFNTGMTGYGVTPNDTFTWTSGTAPNRKFVVSWENVVIGSTSYRATFQVQLFESTGVIVFAYLADSTPSTWSGLSYSTGIDSYGDSRYVTATSGNTNSGHPGNDMQFVPRADAVSGTLLFDKIVSDASGIGNSIASNQPLSGMRLELRRNDGMAMNFGYAASDGTFAIPALGAPSTWTGTLNVLTQNTACVITTTTSTAPREWQARSGIAFGAGTNTGTLTLGASYAALAAQAAGLKAAAFADYSSIEKDIETHPTRHRPEYDKAMLANAEANIASQVFAQAVAESMEKWTKAMKEWYEKGAKPGQLPPPPTDDSNPDSTKLADLKQWAMDARKRAEEAIKDAIKAGDPDILNMFNCSTDNKPPSDAFPPECEEYKQRLAAFCQPKKVICEWAAEGDYDPGASKGKATTPLEIPFAAFLRRNSSGAPTRQPTSPASATQFQPEQLSQGSNDAQRADSPGWTAESQAVRAFVVTERDPTVRRSAVTPPDSMTRTTLIQSNRVR